MSKLTYKDSGVDIDKADSLKSGLKKTLASQEKRVLNTVGAFSSLYDIAALEGISEPVLCLKMEEPGSKQLLAAQNGRLASVGEDLVNHLINDTVMNGGRPLAILDTIVCGKLNNEEVASLIATMVETCKREGCVLVGGETSEQPRVLNDGTYVLSAACIGIVDRKKIIDGSNIQPGDAVFAVSSNGVHTNGYTLVRSLLEKHPHLKDFALSSGESLLEAVLRPHRCYNTPLQRIFRETSLHGLAHITGGGIVDNTKRILPLHLSAEISLSLVQTLEEFSVIHQHGGVPKEDMLRTFNCGVGMVMIGTEEDCGRAAEIFETSDISAYQIGEITTGIGTVNLSGDISF